MGYEQTRPTNPGHQALRGNGDFHCCVCYDRAMGFDVDEQRQRNRIHVIDTAWNIVGCDRNIPGGIDKDVIAAAEALLKATFDKALVDESPISLTMPKF